MPKLNSYVKQILDYQERKKRLTSAFLRNAKSSSENTPHFLKYDRPIEPKDKLSIQMYLDTNAQFQAEIELNKDYMRAFAVEFPSVVADIYRC